MKIHALALCTLSLLLSFFNASAQKSDKVLMTNGVEYEGTVTNVNGDSISFIYKGENLVYRFPKSKLFRIEFASGRTEIFSVENTATSNPSPAAATNGSGNTEMGAPADPKSVAVLPFRYMNANGSDNEMGYSVQQEFYQQATALGSGYKFQDPSKTNATLLKKGINANEIRAYSMDELCSILGVAYVVGGEVKMSDNGASVSSNSNNNISTNKKGEINSSGHTSATATKEYQTNVAISVYSDKGDRVYNGSKQSFWETTNAYKQSIAYLLKRTPFYSK